MIAKGVSKRKTHPAIGRGPKPQPRSEATTSSKTKLIEHPMSVITSLRTAILEGITSDDIKIMVAKQVEKAKEGDKDALRFVFDYVLGGKSAGAPSKLIQNNNYYGKGSKDIDGEVPSPAIRSSAPPGSPEKLTDMADRLRRGVELTHEDDAGFADDEDD